MFSWFRNKFQKKTNQLEYIELLRERLKERSFKWVHWEAYHFLHPGDFGTFQERTGKLVVEGNVYTHEAFAGLVDKYPTSVHDEAKEYELISSGVGRLGAEPDDGSEAFNTEDILFKGHWRCDVNNGAIFLMYDSQKTCVPEELFAGMRQARPAPRMQAHTKHKTSPQVIKNVTINTENTDSCSEEKSPCNYNFASIFRTS